MCGKSICVSLNFGWLYIFLAESIKHAIVNLHFTDIYNSKSRVLRAFWKDCACLSCITFGITFLIISLQSSRGCNAIEMVLYCLYNYPYNNNDNLSLELCLTQKNNWKETIGSHGMFIDQHIRMLLILIGLVWFGLVLCKTSHSVQKEKYSNWSIMVSH